MCSDSTPPLFHTFVFPCAGGYLHPGRELWPKHHRWVFLAPEGTRHTRHPETRTTVLQGSTRLTLLPELPVEKSKSIRGSPCSPLLASRRAFPIVVSPTAARGCCVRETHERQRCASSASFQPLHHGGTQHLVVNADSIHAEDCGRKVSLGGCPQHVADAIRPSPGRQCVLKWCELSCELFRKCPDDPPPHLENPVTMSRTPPSDLTNAVTRAPIKTSAISLGSGLSKNLNLLRKTVLLNVSASPNSKGSSWSAHCRSD